MYSTEAESVRVAAGWVADETDPLQCSMLCGDTDRLVALCPGTVHSWRPGRKWPGLNHQRRIEPNKFIDLSHVLLASIFFYYYYFSLRKAFLVVKFVMWTTCQYPACQCASVEELSHHCGSLQFGISDTWARLAPTQKFTQPDQREKQDLSFTDKLVQS